MCPASGTTTTAEDTRNGRARCPFCKRHPIVRREVRRGRYVYTLTTH